MEGRIFGIKKNIVLLAVAISMFFCFIIMFFLSIFLFKIPSLWFFSFCTCVGIYELTKSFLFKIDSSLYFGFLLCSVSSAGFFCLFSQNTSYFSVLILSCFCLSSIVTFLFFRQRFHLILAFSINYYALYNFLLIKNVISFQIFIAFTVPFLVLLVVSVLSSIKWRK